MIRHSLASIFLLASLAIEATAQPQPRTILKERIKLTDPELRRLEQGELLTKVMESHDPLGLLVFGAVYVNGPLSSLGPAFREVGRLKENKVYLDVQQFSVGGAAPKESDFARLTMDKKDI